MVRTKQMARRASGASAAPAAKKSTTATNRSEHAQRQSARLRGAAANSSGPNKQLEFTNYARISDSNSSSTSKANESSLRTTDAPKTATKKSPGRPRVLGKRSTDSTEDSGAPKLTRAD